MNVLFAQFVDEFDFVWEEEEKKQVLLRRSLHNSTWRGEQILYIHVCGKYQLAFFKAQQ